MDRRKVVCPDCMVAGQTSIVRTGNITTIQKGMYDHYYDEKGDYHRHNPDVTVETFACSKGHHWQEIWSVKCMSCEFQSQPREVAR